MSTEVQKIANAANAQPSTVQDEPAPPSPANTQSGPAPSQNNQRRGLAGDIFCVLPWENQADYTELLASLLLEHDPQTPFEEMLVQKIAQHFWLSQRAVRLQDLCFDREVPMADDQNGLKLYMRYQATHDRAYHKLSAELRTLRNETRKAHIGFVSQKDRQAAEIRREAAENRKQNEDIRRAAAETRRQAAEIRREANESRRSEIHIKRLALLDAQIARLAMPAPAPIAPKSAPDAEIVTGTTSNMRSQAA